MAPSGSPTPDDHAAAAVEVVARMTVEEKSTLCQGASQWTTVGFDHLDVDPVMMSDGPHGMRVQPVRDDHVGLADSLPATCFPTASALAATWDVELVEQVGAAIGREAHDLHTDIVLGPGANIKRSPLCGRNFEYFSEDPHLTGAMATAHVSGVQSQGIGSCLKHFVANNQEYRRLTIDAVIDQRTLREVYLPGFEATVRDAAPWTLMCSYNRVNGTYSSDNSWLLDDVLRGEWGHRGIVMTDWGAMNDRAAAVAAGCDLEMPGPVAGAPAAVAAAVADGRLDEGMLDRTATRLVALSMAVRANRDDEARRRPRGVVDVDGHHALARRAAADAAVLLRNEDAALPIRDGDVVALVGAMAATPRFQGTGSSQINPTRLDDLRTELTTLLGADRVDWVPGYAGTEVDDALVAQAVEAVDGADVAVVHVGLPNLMENEGDDRTHLRLPRSHDALVSAIAAVHDRVVVVLSNGSPVAMPWVHDVAAVVEGYLGGQAGAGGLADVLAGVVAPSGRLAETFPRHLDDVASSANFPGGPATVEYREGIWVGYRHTETVDADVLFPFGHGLSIVPVSFGTATLDVDRVADVDLRDGGVVTVTVPVTNDGDMPTRQVVQVYVRDVEATVHRPDRELKGFAKVALEPGQTVAATVALDRRAFAFWDTFTEAWMVEGGDFEVLVANSSRDIRATLPLTVDGPVAATRSIPPAVARPGVHLDVDRASFEQVLGHPAPSNAPFSRPWTRNTPIGATTGSLAGKALGAAVRRSVVRMMGDDPTAAPLIRALAEEAPLRILVMRGVSLDQVDGLVAMLNGDYRSSARALINEVMEVLRS